MLPIATVRFGLAWSRLRLRLCLRRQVNNVNNESLACSSVCQHFRQAQEMRQQRLKWRDLSPCVYVYVCVWQSRPFEGRTLFLFLFCSFGRQVCTVGTESAPKIQFSVALNESSARFMAKVFRSKPG